jgi:hypothetical protein
MYQDIDCIYLASTLDIFKRAGVNIMYAEKLEPLKAYTWPILSFIDYHIQSSKIRDIDPANDACCMSAIGLN